MNKHKKDFDWGLLGIILLMIFIVISLCFGIYIWIKYGNKPIDEVPSWVIWWMIGGRR